MGNIKINPDVIGNGTITLDKLSENIQSSINKIDTFTSNGVSSIVALTEREYAALETKDSNTLYIVKPNPFPLTGTGTQDNPIIGWHENVAVVINPNQINDGNVSGTIPGIYNFFNNIITSDQEQVLYFDNNGTIISETFYKTDNSIHKMGYEDNAIFICNTSKVNDSTPIEIYNNDLVTFGLVD